MVRFTFRFRGKIQQLSYSGGSCIAKTEEARDTLCTFAEKLEDLWSDTSVKFYLLVWSAKLQNKNPQQLYKTVLRKSSASKILSLCVFNLPLWVHHFFLRMHITHFFTLRRLSY